VARKRYCSWTTTYRGAVVVLRPPAARGLEDVLRHHPRCCTPRRQLLRGSTTRFGPHAEVESAH
jgi:hypothetical protein